MRRPKKNLRSAALEDRTSVRPKVPGPDLWEELDKIESADHQPRFEGFTNTEYSQRYSAGERTAQSRIRSLLVAGHLEKGWKLMDGTWHRVYRTKK